ncbi:DNA internalization-related competence protein ComEC/Rec2 [Thiomicrorhabdus sp. 6S2-11]|uniref:DNA internalization-related competence protein ComEC/Rec2 n=1 Tax=Thiomicrorhabdus marina TaxID=2818442 RepID=A0ABS3Q3E6_9GAMM|nr:DNA internalization-related competence protein ComEC/Rec2 [Thiomicrorhabdus marina]MBO1926811.1 DNA internalization-related competence protein ComEC/Rec2 [Thiomicrorhabdus marina]
MFHYFVIGWLIAITYFYQLENRVSENFGWFLAICSLVIVLFALMHRNLHPNATSSLRDNQLLLFRHKFWNLSAGLIIGFTWALWQSFSTQNLPQNLFNQHLLLQVKVLESTEPEELSASERSRRKLTLAVEQVHSMPWQENRQQSLPLFKAGWLKPKIQVSLHAFSGRMPLIKNGETWLMAVKLKAPYSSQNPFSRDYESYLFQRGIQAKGYLPYYSAERWQAVQKQFSEAILTVDESMFTGKHFFAIKLQSANVWNWRVWRTALYQYWQEAFAPAYFWRIYQALLVGERRQMSTEDWQLLQQTGTTHLMAISGLHLAIMAVLGAALFKGVWWLGAYRIERLKQPIFTAFGAALLASAYLLISGMAIPTQRAWIMVMVVLLFIFVRRKFQPWSALAIAVFLVLLVDSRAVLSSGFWLSFLAVALIFISLPWLKGRVWWQQLLILQSVLTIGLAPLLVWYFSQVPTLSFLANIVAIPVVSFIMLPLLFLTAVLALLSPTIFSWVLPLNEWLWQQLWAYLNWLQSLQKDLPFNSHFAEQNLFWLLSVYVVLLFGVLLFRHYRIKQQALQGFIQALTFSQRKAHLRAWKKGRRKLQALSFAFISALLVSILSFQTWQIPERGSFWLTLFDTGQGLALSVETAGHRMIYDTGPQWGKLSAAQFSVIPYWQNRGNLAIDKLIVSHSDKDHAGGLSDLLASLPIRTIVSGQADKLETSVKITQCVQGQIWQWDGVQFEILAPKAQDLGRINNDNDFSCVLKVTSLQNPMQSLLISGDLGSQAEAQLIKEYDEQSEKLQSALFIAGHHGSRFSSSKEFLDVVAPQIILFSAGYQNHFGFPSDKVLQRIARLTTAPKLFNTACSGALHFKITPEKIELVQQTRKQRAKWYHQRCLHGIK